MTTASEYLQRKRPNEATCDVLLNPALATEHARLRAEITDAEAEATRTNDRTPTITAARLKERLAELETNIRAETVTFRFQGCGTLRFREMLDECPPTPIDNRSGLDYEAAKFGPLLIAECAAEPTFTLDEARKLWAEWTDAEVSRVFNTAMAANRVVRDVPFTRDATGKTGTSERNSTTAPHEESHTGIS